MSADVLSDRNPIPPGTGTGLHHTLDPSGGACRVRPVSDCVKYRPGPCYIMVHEAWTHTGMMLSAAAVGIVLGSYTGFGGFSASLIEPFLMLMLFLVFLSVDMRRMKGSFANVRFLT